MAGAGESRAGSATGVGAVLAPPVVTIPARRGRRKQRPYTICSSTARLAFPAAHSFNSPCK